MWLYLNELQFKFEFRSGRMTNSNLNCNSSRYSQILNINSIYQRTSRKSPDNLKFLSSNFVPVEWYLAELWLLNLYFLFKFYVVRTFFWRPLIYWLSSLNCNSSRYSQIPNIKSIYQRTSRKSPDNVKFEQKIQVQVEWLFGWAMTLELVFLFKF
jgi:hypothetical protein